ncbi:hypothetical protein KVM49_03225 [Helicobacter pylori]|nr:hypothetical protein KVM49_03225 [Helicobacter pylori]
MVSLDFNNEKLRGSSIDKLTIALKGRNYGGLWFCKEGGYYCIKSCGSLPIVRVLVKSKNIKICGNLPIVRVLVKSKNKKERLIEGVEEWFNNYNKTCNKGLRLLNKGVRK